MRRRVVVALVVSCLALACRSEEQPTPAVRARPAPSLSPSAAALPMRLTPQLVAEQTRDGLRVRSGTLGSRGAWGFSDIALDFSKIKLKIVQAPRGAPLPELLPQGALAVINGGYFETDFRPSTWLKQGGIELAPKTDTSKGGLLAVGAHGVYVGPFSRLGFEPELAVQSFPLIVEADGSPGIRRDDGRRAARTVVCLSGAELHFVLIAAPRGEGPTLFESVSLLRTAWPGGFGCRAALNLDGGPSSGVWFAPEVGAKQRAPFAPVAYAIALEPR